MPKLIPENQIFKIKLLRNSLIVFLSIAMALSMYNVFFIYPSLTERVIDNTKNDALRVAKYLATTFMPEKNGQRQPSYNIDKKEEIERIINTFELAQLKLYSSRGEIIFSSKPDDIGNFHKEKYFHEIVARGNVYVAVVKKAAQSLTGEKKTVDVVETYVPLMDGDIFLGAFEIYYDITNQKKKFDKLISFSSMVLFIVVFGLFSAIGLVWLKEKKTMAARRQIENALIESEEKLAGILNSFTDFVIVVDRDLKIAWANIATFDFLGADPVGRKYNDVFAPQNPNHTINWIEKCFQAGCGVEDEIECINAEGVRMDLWYTASVATRSQDGAVETLIAVYRDITEKKQLRAEAVRSGQLASIGELAAGVAHEINNPINGIINCAQLLIDENRKNHEQEEIFQRIIKAGQRIAMIVRNLLSFARNTDDEPQLAAVKSLLSDCLDLTEAQLRKDGIDIKVDIPDNFPELKVRSHHIQQVFLNIFSNARYALNQCTAMTRKNKTIEIKGELLNSLIPPHVRLIFFDNGTGIPADIINRICDPFFSSKPAGEGTGLGLSISHSIIKDHGGRMNFDSIEGAYTKVIIDLPVPGEDDFEKKK